MSSTAEGSTGPLDGRLPRISVVIATYQYGTFIADAIRSVLMQTQPVAELFIVDDGSTDDTEAIVRGFGDPRIHYHRQEHAGVSTARNAGLERATGDYIAFLDADDRWRPTMLAQQLALLASDPSLVCCFADFVRFVHQTGQPLARQFTFYHDLPRVATRSLPGGLGERIEGNAFKTIVGFGEFPAFMLTMLFRADVVRDLRFEPALVRCQDVDFVLRVCARGDVAFSRSVVADVRRHGRNATRDYSLIALDKLRALEHVRRDPAVRPHRRALERRIARARFDAIGALLQHRRFRDAMTLWQQALRTPVAPLRTIRSSLRVAALMVAMAPRWRPLVGGR